MKPKIKLMFTFFYHLHLLILALFAKEIDL